MTKRNRLGYTERRSYTPLMWGMQAERTVRVPRMRMSESCSELLVLAIFFRKSGRSSWIAWEKVGSSSSGSISAVSAISAISAVG